MKIKTKFNNILPKEFGKEAKREDIMQGNPVRSFAFEVDNLPKGTEYIAFTLIDYDAIAVCSFPWIHWSVADLKVNGDSIQIEENMSRIGQLIQGKNSFSSQFLDGDFSEIDTMFVGPTPPDRDHNYTLKVFALSEKTGLENGFWVNELLNKVKDLTLGTVELDLIGKC